MRAPRENVKCWEVIAQRVLGVSPISQFPLSIERFECPSSWLLLLPTAVGHQPSVLEAAY